MPVIRDSSTEPQHACNPPSDDATPGDPGCALSTEGRYTLHFPPSINADDPHSLRHRWIRDDSGPAGIGPEGFSTVFSPWNHGGFAAHISR
jgi:hypothetical protein